jgi:hypothetical protein
MNIIRMAREAGFKRHHNPDLYDCMVASDEAIERFAALVAAAEREACAQLCDRMASRTNDIRSAALEMAAENIRARGNT